MLPATLPGGYRSRADRPRQYRHVIHHVSIAGPATYSAAQIVTAAAHATIGHLYQP